LFEGTGSPIAFGVGLTAPPLIDAPSIAPIVSLALVMALSVVGLSWTVRARSFDNAFGILICLVVLVSPVTWSFSLLPILIPMAVVARNLSDLDWRERETSIAFGLGVALFIPPLALVRLAVSLSDSEMLSDGRLSVPFYAATMALWPAVAILALLWFVWRLDRVSPQAAA
jgi:hypothetical protein